MNKMYHCSNGKIFCAPSEIKSMDEYKAWIKNAYGSLRGIKFVEAKNRKDAAFKFVNL